MQGEAVEHWCETDEYKHPMFDKIRQHSTTPDAACLFFMQVLHVDPERRHGQDYCLSPYVKPVAEEMEAAKRMRGKLSSDP